MTVFTYEIIMIIALLVGALAGFGFNRFVGARPKRARELYVLGLIVTAMIYVVMAFLGGASNTAIIIESAGVLLFGIFVLLSVTHHAWWLGVGWLLHPVWDVVFHKPFDAWTHAPEWYVFACISFDLMVGVAVLRALRSTPDE